MKTYVNRELSWLDFNACVLGEALDPTTPLLERVKFLAIVSKNLDEFFEVRVARLRQMIAENKDKEDDGHTPAEILAKARATIQELEARASAAWDALAPDLAKAGIQVLGPAEWTPEDKALLDDALERGRGALAVAKVEPATLPLVKNGQLFLAVATPRGVLSHLVVIGPDAARLLKLPAPAGAGRFALLEDVLRANVSRLVPGARSEDCSLVRLTRDTNFYLNEEGEAELVASIRENAHNDAEDLPIRLQHEARALAGPLLELARRYGLGADGLSVFGSLPSLRDLFPLASLDAPALKDPPQPPVVPRVFADAKSMFAAIAKGDVLLIHPYHSFDPIVRFVQEAAADPDVRAIHTTLYRTTSTSPIVAALLDAAKGGKVVSALIEAKARFDEATNVARAQALGQAGVRVSLGLRGLKTHAKALLVDRREGGKLVRYAHLGTGNYNEKSARLYGDLSLFTCDPEVTDELAQVFGWLESVGPRPAGKKHRVWNAPNLLRDKIEALIERETKHAREGRPARIIIKLNGLADPSIADGLAKAADAGVHVDVIVRGACTLRPPQDPTSRLKVRRVVDRYLEHGRVYFFLDGGPKHGKPDVYLASADLMGRNLDKRVELMFKVRGDELIQEILDYLELQLRDDVKGRAIGHDGTSRPVPRGKGVRCQVEQYERVRRLAR